MVHAQSRGQQSTPQVGRWIQSRKVLTRNSKVEASSGTLGQTCRWEAKTPGANA